MLNSWQVIQKTMIYCITLAGSKICIKETWCWCFQHLILTHHEAEGRYAKALKAVLWGSLEGVRQLGNPKGSLCWVPQLVPTLGTVRSFVAFRIFTIFCITGCRVLLLFIWPILLEIRLYLANYLEYISVHYYTKKMLYCYRLQRAIEK